MYHKETGIEDNDAIIEMNNSKSVERNQVTEVYQISKVLLLNERDI